MKNYEHFKEYGFLDYLTGEIIKGCTFELI